MTTHTNPMSATFEQLHDNFSQTLKASSDFHEQTMRFWKSFSDQGGSNVREQFEKVSQDMTPFSKTNIERFQRLFDEQADRTVELLHETFEICKADSPGAVYEETLKLWRQSLDNVRASNEMFAKANADMFEQFSKFTRGASARPEPKAPAKAPK